ETRMHNLEELESLSVDARWQTVLPVTDALPQLPALQLEKSLASRLMSGQKIPRVQGNIGLYKVYAEANEFVGIGELTAGGVLRARRMLSPPNGTKNQAEVVA
ncbi:MAG: tRNA pseudouridine(55) synthase TruB, partial [Gammaproteobacteria bacterium]